MSSLNSIKRLATGRKADKGPLKGLVMFRDAKHAIDEAHIVVPQQKNTMTKRQKKLKARKIARQSRAYNIRRAK